MERAKAIEKVNVILMVSLFILLFSALFLAFVMDLNDGTCLLYTSDAADE